MEDRDEDRDSARQALLPSGTPRRHGRTGTDTGVPYISPNDSDENDYLIQMRGKPGLTCNLVLAVTSCVLGSSFQFGYNTGVVNAPQEVIQDFIKSSYRMRYSADLSTSSLTLIWSLIVSIYAVGGMLGGAVAGFLANRFGRKGTILLNNIVCILGGVMMSVSFYIHNYELLVAGRFIIGVNCGVSTAVAPMYLSEIAPTSLRGATGTINQFAIVVGILLSQVLGLQQILGTQGGLPLLFGVIFIPAFVQLITLPFCSKSPRYLLLYKDDRGKAEKALMWLRNKGSIAVDLEEMDQEFESQRFTPKASLCDMFRNQSLRTPLIISVVLQLSQQLSGINAVIFYSTSVFESAGLSHDIAQYATITVGAVNVGMTFVSAILMDRSGRRTLHLYGLGGMWIFCNIITISFLWQKMWSFMSIVAVISTLMYVFCFAIGPGSIPWFIVAELFSQDARSAAVSIAVAVNWLANFTVGITFPLLQETLKNYSFVPFIILLAIFWIYTYVKVPETKNRSIEEITALFRTRDPYASRDGQLDLSD